MARFLPIAAALCAPALALAPLTATAASTNEVVARTVASWSDVVDGSGNRWVARRGLVGGTGNSALLAGKDVLGTTEDALYGTSSYTSTGYSLPVSAGRYRVRLLMAEGYWGQPGQRVFDVTAEGRAALSRVDIVAAVGKGAAYDRTFEVDVNDGTLSVAFVKVVDNPLIAGVEVTLVGPVGMTTTSPTSSPSTSQSPTSSTTTSTSTTQPTTSTSAPTSSTTSAPTTAPTTTSTTSGTSPTTSTPGGETQPIVLARTVVAATSVTDRAGQVWAARRSLVGPTTVTTALVGKDVLRTDDDALYATSSYTTTGYSLPVAVGRYRVRLLMAEGYWTKAGQRVFDVTAEGRPGLTGVDIAGAVGKGVAYDRSFDVDVTDGLLTLAFVKVLDKPLIAAIEVARVPEVAVSPTQPPTPTTPPAGRAPVPVAPDSPWITRIEAAPLDPYSTAMAGNLRSDVVNNWGGVAAFNNTHYNASFYPVSPSQARVDVDYWNCQRKSGVDPNLYSGPGYFLQVPVPEEAKPASGSDGAISIYDASTDQLWEFWQMRRNATTGRWEACWGGRADQISQGPGIFPRYYGATATGVAMAAGMISLDDVRRGSIDHALYLGVMNAQAYPAFSWPALRADGNITSPYVVREGQRLRLKPSLDLRGYNLTPIGRLVADAAQRYGFIVSDRSGAVAVIAESGLREKALTGTDPWATLLGNLKPYEVMRNFPWEALQVVQSDYGKPAELAPATP